MRRISILISFVFLSLILPAQETNVSLAFTRYLIQNKLYKDALLELKNLEKKNSLSDSISFLRGWIYEESRQPDSAIFNYERISVSSPCYTHAACRTAFLKALQGNFSSVDTLLSFTPEDSCANGMRIFFYDALHLAQKETHGTLILPDKVCYPELNWKQKLEDYPKTLSQTRKKSPWVAGTLSAFVPGLGKVYAGKPKQGLIAILPLAALALQAWEGYADKGLKSGRFWVYGSLFTIFYAGNIYGSAISVKIVQQEKHDQMENQILVDLRISLQQIMGR